jgi:hypothetical protein
MGHNARQQAARPCAYRGKNDANSKSRNEAATALVQMRESKKSGRSHDGGSHRASKPVLKNPLHETTINQFLAEGYRCDQSEEGQAFDVILRKKLQRQLRQNSLNFCRVRDQAAQAHYLIEKNERGEHDCDSGGERRIGYSQPKLTRANFMRVGAPQNHSGGNPLKRKCRSVKRNAIHLRGARHAHQLADAAAPEQRHGNAQKKQNEGEIPMHGDK